MPAVTVPCRPSGEPIAMTGSPTASESELPRLATVSSSVGTLSTARSLMGSSPTIWARAVASSEKVTRIVPVSRAIDDDMVVGEDVAVLVDDHARSRPRTRSR